MYGAMSFTDKLANGIAIQIVQLCHPCNKQKLVCCSACHTYYRQVMVYGPGGPSVAALVSLILLAICIKQLAAKSTESERTPLLRTASMESCNSCQQLRSECMCDYPINRSTSSS